MARVLATATKRLRSPSESSTPLLKRRLGDEAYAGFRPRPAQRTEHGSVVHRLRRGNGGIGIAHGSGDDEATLDNQGRLDAEEGGSPQRYIRQLADLKGTHYMADAMGDGWVDGVLGDITLDAEIVVLGGVAFQIPRCTRIL